MMRFRCAGIAFLSNRSPRGCEYDGFPGAAVMPGHRVKRLAPPRIELPGDQHRADNYHRHVEDQHEPGRIAGRTHEMFANTAVYVRDGVVGGVDRKSTRLNSSHT